MYSLFAVNILLIFIVQNVCSSFINPYPEIKSEPLDGDAGKPLILTPLIEQNKIKEAQNASKVIFDGFKNVTSYSGYFTVNKNFNSNMFFWFFPSEKNYLEDPVVLWLQGGPGASSLFGLFEENGPFIIKKKHGLKLRKYSWTKMHSVIYIDNPVGTGYSFTDDGGYAKNETAVGKDLYEALLQFFRLFPELQKNKFFITGESYAGKYVPAIGYTIHQNNPTAKIKINLKGLSIGNGFCDPEHQLHYSDYLYQIGLIDINARNDFIKTENEGINLIKTKQFLAAFKIFDELIDGDLSGKPSLFQNASGFSNYFNYLIADGNSEIDYMGKYIQRVDVRAAIHVGNSKFSGEDKTVELKLIEDIPQSIAPWLIELLNHYQVLIYNGQLDIIVAYPLTLNFLQNLKFSGAEKYKTNPRHKWYVDGVLAGYVKHAGNLTEVMVRNAGHMVPADQPKWAFDLITKFTYHEV